MSDPNHPGNGQLPHSWGNSPQGQTPPRPQPPESEAGGASWTPDAATLNQQKATTKRPWYLDVGFFVAWVGGLFAVVWLLLGALVPVVVKAVPPETEASMFASMGDQFMEDMSPSDRARAERLQSIVDRLAVHWDDNPYDQFRVAVMQESAPNAFAVPGGVIVVTTGLLEMVDSENELAFVLGHEIGHFAHRHHLRRMGRIVVIAALVALFVDGGTGFLVPVAAEFAARLTENGFSRSQETESDEFGLEIVYEEYGHVHGSTHFFDELPDLSEQLGSVGGYLSTHPLNDERIGHAEDFVSEHGWPSEGPLLPLDPQLVQGLGDGTGQRTPPTPAAP